MSFCVRKPLWLTTTGYGFHAVVDPEECIVKAWLYEYSLRDDDVLVMSYIVCDDTILLTGIKSYRHVPYVMRVLTSFDDEDIGKLVMRELAYMITYAHPRARTIRIYSDDVFQSLRNKYIHDACHASVALSAFLPPALAVHAAKYTLPEWTMFRMNPGDVAQRVANVFPAGAEDLIVTYEHGKDYVRFYECLKAHLGFAV
jgi:hypothetical protein